MHKRSQVGLKGTSFCLVLAFAGVTGLARAQETGAADAPPVVAHPLAQAGAAGSGSSENLTVLGKRNRFQPAPMPGAPMGPPPDKPAPHLGRYKISGDQSKKDGYDTQTGAYIAPFGSAYTNAGPVSDGMASHHEGVGGSGP